MTSRRDWLRAVRFMVGAGFRAGAGSTTVRIAQDLAARMWEGGTVAYCQAGMIRRLGLSKRCIALHVQILRELGLLAWVERGSSRRNSLRTRHGAEVAPGDGFRRSATVYALVVPRAWDDSMGHRIGGEGYAARVIGVTGAGRERAVAEVRERTEKAAGQAVENPVESGSSCTPSPLVPRRGTSCTYRRGESKDRPRQGAAGSRKSPKIGKTKGSTGWTAQQAASAMAEARMIQLHTWWAQGSCVRQFAYALRPFFDAGWAGPEIARELGRWTVPLRPQNLAAYVASEVRRRVNGGLLFLPDGSVVPYREAPAAEDRYDAWMAARRLEQAQKWDRQEELRRSVRQHVRPGVSKRPKRARGMADARPDRVLSTSQELSMLCEAAGPLVVGEALAAQVEEITAARELIEDRGSHWETALPAPEEPYAAV
ncbi:hypothetical protein ABTY59_31890 [Streptomyces sp. NPDC096079]|uniref:hypothetical protein n=1 Tax=Streptomyces sp. NPDC096079 TaxID=3155820 RepID=UPI00332FE8C5